MKMSPWLTIALLSGAGLISCARAAAPDIEASVPVLVDGRLAGAALVRGGVAYLPLRSVAKALHLTVGYNADAQMIIVTTPQDGPPPSNAPVQ